MPGINRVAALFIAFLIVALFPSTAAYAQPPVSVTGRVIDAQSLAAIAGAKVAAGGVEQVTDADGRFTVALPAGMVTIEASAGGYLPEARTLTLAADAPTVTFEFLLTNRSQVSESVAVKGDLTPIDSQPATTDVTPLEVRSVAGAVDNVYRVLQTLPGVSAADEIGSRLTVRGGGPDQNLTIMDGIEIHNPYRLFGLFSAFNPETIQNFQLTAGGFGAQYGDRLSSLLVVDSRPGSESRAFTGSFTVGVADTNVVAEGKLPGSAKGSWLFTARRTYYDVLVGRIIDQDLPSFGDLQATVSWLPRPGQRLTVFALRSREHTDAAFDEETDDERFTLKSDANNDLAALSFLSSLGSNGSSRTIVSWYRNTEALGVDGRFHNDAQRSNAPGPSPFANVVFTRNLLLGDVVLREELALKTGARHTLESGFEFHSLDTGWGWTISGDRNPSAANGSSVRGGAGLPDFLDSSRRSTRLGLWLTDRWDITPRLRLEPGLRFDRSGINRESVISPRLALFADVGGGVRLKAAGGLYTQSPGYEKLLQSDYFVDLSGADRIDLGSERAWHGIVGLERTFSAGLSLRLEGYVKTFDDLIVGRLETPGQVQARINAYDFPPDLSADVPSTPVITTAPVNGGSGRAYGFDLYMARQAVSPSTRLTGWASYTYGKADVTAYGRTYPFDYDRRHAASIVGMFQLSRLIGLGATARIASGFPRTPAVGLRTAAVERTVDGVTTFVPARDQDQRLIYTIDLGGIDNLNTGRLPIFARVDVRTTFTPGWMNRSWQLYAEIINVLKRKNAGSLEPDLEYDPASSRPRITYRRDAGVPLVPTFGVRYRF